MNDLMASMMQVSIDVFVDLHLLNNIQIDVFDIRTNPP